MTGYLTVNWALPKLEYVYSFYYFYLFSTSVAHIQPLDCGALCVMCLFGPCGRVFTGYCFILANLGCWVYSQLEIRKPVSIRAVTNDCFH